MVNYIIEPERETPIFERVDVIVAGGGPAGFSAAVAAARDGADTLLVERYGRLGGGFTAMLASPIPIYGLLTSACGVKDPANVVLWTSIRAERFLAKILANPLADLSGFHVRTLAEKD